MGGRRPRRPGAGRRAGDRPGGGSRAGTGARARTRTGARAGEAHPGTRRPQGDRREVTQEGPGPAPPAGVPGRAATRKDPTVDPAVLAWLLAQLGPTTDPTDLAARYERL